MNDHAIHLSQSLRADPYPAPDYRVCRSRHEIIDLISFLQATEVSAYHTHNRLLIAEDTESLPDGSPYCLTFSSHPGTGGLIYTNDTDAMWHYRDIITRTPNLQLFHNYLHDVVPFNTLNLPIHKFLDTMVLSYHLCLGGGGDDEDSESKAGRGSLSLKSLAYRNCNMQMTSFKDTVYPHSIPYLTNWLQTASGILTPLPKVKRCICGCPSDSHELRGKTQRCTGPCTLCGCRKHKAGKPAPVAAEDKVLASLFTKSNRLALKLATDTTTDWADSKKDPWKFIQKNWTDDLPTLTTLAGPIPVPSIAHVPEPQLLYYACLSGESRVSTPEGYRKIKDLVKSRYTGLVHSFNQESGCIEEKQVIGHYQNQHNSPVGWLSIETEHTLGSRWGTGTRYTPDHRLLTTEGYKPIREIQTGTVLLLPRAALSTTVHQVVVGSILGDGWISQKNNGWSCLKFSHCAKQLEYLRWKQSLLVELHPTYSDREERELIIDGKQAHGSKFREISTEYHPELNAYVSPREKRIGDWVSRLDALSIAIWYQDDGSLVSDRYARLYTLSFSLKEIHRLQQALFKFNIVANYYETNRPRQYAMTIPAMSCGTFFTMIRNYVHPSMQYKLPEEHRGFFSPVVIQASNRLVESRVTRVFKNPTNRRGSIRTSYCLDVADTHNFLTMGEVSHNCRDADATLRLYLWLRRLKPWLFYP